MSEIQFDPECYTIIYIKFTVPYISKIRGYIVTLIFYQASIDKTLHNRALASLLSFTFPDPV